jgi:hypothetical protein
MADVHPSPGMAVSSTIPSCHSDENQPTRSMADEVCVKVLRSVSELDAIRQVWASWPGNRDSEIGSYTRFVQSSTSTLRPHVVAVFRGSTPEAILVGRVDLGHITCRLGYWRVNLPARILYFVYGALRGNASLENCDVILRSVLRSLSDHEADVAYMNFLRTDSELYRLATERPWLLNRDYVRTSQRHFVTSLPSSVEEFYKALSSGARWQTKSKQKKLLKDFRGEVKIRCFREPSELGAMIRDVEQVAGKSYQRGLGVGFVGGPEALEALRFKAERGWLRAYVLYLADRPCAFWIGDVNEGTFGSDYLGYDAEFAKYSPGMFLILKTIEGFCDGSHERVTEVDFATGYAQYKEVLSNREWRETGVYIFAPTFKGIALNVLRTAISGTDQVVKGALSRMGLLQKIKKRWRDHARASKLHESSY